MISMLLAAAMVASLAVGCSGGGGTEEQGTAEGEKPADGEKQKLIAMTWNDFSDAERIRDVMFEQFPELEKKIEIEYILAGSSNTDVAEKYRLSLASDSYICDFMYFNGDDVAEFAYADTLMELDDIYNADGIKDEIMPKALEVATYNDKLVAVPQEIKQTLWFYNKTMFDEAGIDPKEIKTTEQFIEAGKKFMEVFPDTAFFHGVPKAGYYMALNIMAHNNVVFKDEDGNYTIDSDPVIRKCLEDTYEILHSGINAEIQEWTPEWESGFKDRVMASTLTESYFKTFGSRLLEESEDEWGVALWPGFGGEVSGMGAAGGLVMVIPKSAKNPELAKEWLQKCFLSKEGREVLHETSKLAPIREDVFDEVVDKVDSDWGETYNPATHEAVQLGGLPAFTESSQYSKERTILSEYVAKYLNDEIGLDEMLTKCNQDLEQQINKK